MPRIVPLVLFALLNACLGQPTVAPAGRVAHTVYFWLAEDAPAGTADALIDYYRTEVPRAPGIESIVVGAPRPSDRDVVDDSFSVGVTTVFASDAAEVAWQTEPIHDELKRRFMPHFAKVVVYDTEVPAAR